MAGEIFQESRGKETESKRRMEGKERKGEYLESRFTLGVRNSENYPA